MVSYGQTGRQMPHQETTMFHPTRSALVIIAVLSMLLMGSEASDALPAASSGTPTGGPEFAFGIGAAMPFVPPTSNLSVWQLMVIAHAR
jgi:hypothetical protein